MNHTFEENILKIISFCYHSFIDFIYSFTYKRHSKQLTLVDFDIFWPLEYYQLQLVEVTISYQQEDILRMKTSTSDTINFKETLKAKFIKQTN